jgi:hypothetical protein
MEQVNKFGVMKTSVGSEQFAHAYLLHNLKFVKVLRGLEKAWLTNVILEV